MEKMDKATLSTGKNQQTSRIYGMYNSIFYDNPYNSITVATKPSANDELKAPCSIPPHASNTTAFSNRGETTEEGVQEGKVREVQNPNSLADAKESEDAEPKRDGQESSEALVSKDSPETPYKNRNIVQQLDWLQSDDDSTISNTSVSSVYTDVDIVLNLFSNVQVTMGAGAKMDASMNGLSPAAMVTSTTGISSAPTTPTANRTREREGADFTPPTSKDPRLRSPNSEVSKSSKCSDPTISSEYSLVKVFIDGQPYWK
jgi:hypothetical protein